MNLIFSYNIYTNELLADENWLAQYENNKNSTVLLLLQYVQGWRGGLFLASSTIFCHSFDSRALSDVHTNFHVFLPLGIKGNIENYFREIHLQIQSETCSRANANSLKIKHSQTRKHNRVIFISDVFWTHFWLFCGFPMSTL